MVWQQCCSDCQWKLN